MPADPLLILGGGGLLGRALADEAARRGVPHTAYDRVACDIGSAASVRTAFDERRPGLVVCAAAATDVDRCEREPAYAFRANALGPRLLALEAARRGVRLVHISTDYVFAGDRPRPYDELDEPRPVSVYGRSKLEGERAVLAASAAHVVLRTAWLFGRGGKNFVARMPDLLKQHGALTAIADQTSSPTAADELAAWIFDHGSRLAGGTYHAVNEGPLSYYEAARLCAEGLGLDVACVKPSRSVEVPRPAARPAYSPLVSTALRAEGVPLLRSSAEALRAYARAVRG